MGYYTDFELNVSRYQEKFNQSTLDDSFDKNVFTLIQTELDKIGVFDYIEEYGDGVVASGNAKWYEYGNDMLLLSSKFPNVLFDLQGRGESSDDFWRRYYMNGKYQDANSRIVEDDFSPDKLIKTPIPEKYSTE